MPGEQLSLSLFREGREGERRGLPLHAAGEGPSPCPPAPSRSRGRWPEGILEVRPPRRRPRSGHAARRALCAEQIRPLLRGNQWASVPLHPTNQEKTRGRRQNGCQESVSLRSGVKKLTHEEPKPSCARRLRRTAILSEGKSDKRPSHAGGDRFSSHINCHVKGS